MRSTLSRTGEATYDAIESLAHEGLGAQAFLEGVHERLDRAVPSDGVFIAAADPDSGLAMGAGVATVPHEICAPFWEHEFLVPDYSKFADLASGPRHAADLHAETGGRPERSARWRAFSKLVGSDGELRASFTVDGSSWGMAALYRCQGASRYSPDEVDFVERLAPVIARGLRFAMTSTSAAPAVDRGPGMAILDREGNLISLTGEAELWIDELATASFPRPSMARGYELPFEISALASVARARAGGEGQPPRMRMRTDAGVWLLAHASVLRGTDEHVALVIEPAKASEIAPLIIEAYGLTPRELEVTRMIARGLKTSEMAAELFLSAHTIRDHVKAIFEKVGVSSRGELVATIFADHYHPTLDAALLGPTSPATA
jgi:DNA-binding CsgD family transcriptional regulator